MGAIDQVIVSRQQLAALAGVSAEHIIKLQSEGLPVLTRGKGRGNRSTYDAVAALRWLRDRSEGRSGLERERERLTALQADRQAQIIAEAAGELVPADQVEQELSALVLAARERLLSLPSTALQRGLVTTTDQEDQLIGMVHEVLDELSRGSRE